MTYKSQERNKLDIWENIVDRNRYLKAINIETTEKIEFARIEKARAKDGPESRNVVMVQAE